jgi:hypothetical protein
LNLNKMPTRQGMLREIVSWGSGSGLGITWKLT